MSRSPSIVPPCPVGINPELWNGVHALVAKHGLEAVVREANRAIAQSLLASGQTPQQAKAEGFARLCAAHAKKAAEADSARPGQAKRKIKTAESVNTLRFMPQHAEGYAAWNAEGGKPDPRTFLD